MVPQGSVAGVGTGLTVSQSTTINRSMINAATIVKARRRRIPAAWVDARV
jgi:hypothetical protein